MRLVYLFTSDGASQFPDCPWNEEIKSTNYYATTGLPTEGFYALLQEMRRRKIVDDVVIFIESARGPGKFTNSSGIVTYTIPHISQIDKFIQNDDVMLVRGGFKSWFPMLTKWSAAKRWILFYRAATNRGNWTFWDVVLNDLIDKPFVDSIGRFHFKFNKPTVETMFFPKKYERLYDVCVGASHIHEKKAQWKVINMAVAYREKYKKDLRMVLTGSFHGGENSRQIPSIIKRNCLQVDMTGMLLRQQMIEIYNKSKLFIHVGTSGQNDRGVLEAMCCGTPVMLQHAQFHAPFTYKSKYSFLTSSGDDPERFSVDVNQALSVVNEDWREKVYKDYIFNNGLANVVIPQMERLFSVIKRNKTANRSLLPKEYENELR